MDKAVAYAEDALREVHEMLVAAVNNSDPFIRALQDQAIASGQLSRLLETTKLQDQHTVQALAFETLQVICYRNKPAVQQLVDLGLMPVLEMLMDDPESSRQVQVAALYLLSAMCALNMQIHSQVLESTIPRTLVDILQRNFYDEDSETECGSSSDMMRCQSEMAATGRWGVTRVSCAVEILRHLCHNEANHVHLVSLGVADIMCHLMHMSQLSVAPPSDAASDFETMASAAADRLHSLTSSRIGSIGGDSRPSDLRSVVDGKSRDTAVSSRRTSIDSDQSWGMASQHEQCISQRINAAMAVAILVGHDEENPLLEMDDELTMTMLDVLEHACRKELRYGVHWTVWKLTQAFANLAVNDANKTLILEHDGVDVLGQCLLIRHTHMVAVQRYTAMCLWHLAFLDVGRAKLKARTDIMECVKTLAVSSKDAVTRDVSKGCLWTLDMKALHQYMHNAPLRLSSTLEEDEWLEKVRANPEAQQQHLMISYEWSCQQRALLLKQELVKRGYIVWMDVEKMSGSTLEAMALAVENSAAVLVCYSKKYKESQACRTEAEYAFQMRKRVIPILMEADYRPTGWLGALLGTKLYFDCSDRASIPLKILLLERELGNIARRPDYGAKPPLPHGASSSRIDSMHQMERRVFRTPSLLRLYEGMKPSRSAQQLHPRKSVTSVIDTQVSQELSAVASDSSVPDAPSASRSSGSWGNGTAPRPLMHPDLQGDGREPTSHGCNGSQTPRFRTSLQDADHASPVAEEGCDTCCESRNGKHHPNRGFQACSFPDADIPLGPESPEPHGSLHGSLHTSLHDPVRRESPFLRVEAPRTSAPQQQTCNGFPAEPCADIDNSQSAFPDEGRFLSASNLSHRLAPVEQWTKEQVTDWLTCAAKLPELVPTFDAGKIDGRGLCGLMRMSKSGCLRSCLKEDLEISPPGLLLAFVQELHKLFD